MAWLAVRDPDTLSDAEQTLLQRIRQEATADRAIALAQQFAYLVRKRQVSLLDDWLERSATSSIPSLQHFAKGIQTDVEAVRAALELPWSNGQAEGQITRLKYLKRQMYGRASLDLLRIRALHAPS